MCKFIIDYVTAGQKFALDTQFAKILVADGRVDQDLLLESLRCKRFPTDDMLHPSDLLTSYVNKFTDLKRTGPRQRDLCFDAFHDFLSMLNQFGNLFAISGALEKSSRSFVQLGLVSTGSFSTVDCCARRIK